MQTIAKEKNSAIASHLVKQWYYSYFTNKCKSTIIQQRSQISPLAKLISFSKGFFPAPLALRTLGVLLSKSPLLYWK